jgi:hypothetical protein
MIFELLGLIGEIWSQEDSAVAQRAWESLKCFSAMIPVHQILLLGGIAWPPNSPGLTAPDFFLRGCLKSEVYDCNLRTIMEIKEDINDKIKAISAVFFLKMIENFKNE